MNLDGIRNTGTECPYDGLIETNFDGTGYPTNWLYQFDSVLHLVMYKDPQGDSLWHPLWPGSEYVDHEDRPLKQRVMLTFCCDTIEYCF